MVNESSAARRLPRTMVARLMELAWTRHGDGDRPVAVNVLVVDDRRIAAMNRRYLRRNGPTDTLAFPDGDPDPRTGRVELGDVAASAETARREAARRRADGPGWTARHELALYLLHGMLHLLGLDDRDPGEAAGMRKAETEIFEAAGLPPPPA